MKFAVIAVVSFVLLATISGAQAANKSRFRNGPEVRGHGQRKVREEGKTVIYKQKNVVDFDDSLIEGDVKNPSEFYFTVRPSGKGKSLVERRKNFHKEMLRDSVMIR